MRVELFIDPVSGWSWWTPALLVEEEPRADQERTEARQGPAGQGLLVRLLGRVGAWLGVCEQTPSGAWQRIQVARRPVSNSNAPAKVMARPRPVVSPRGGSSGRATSSIATSRSPSTSCRRRFCNGLLARRSIGVWL